MWTDLLPLMTYCFVMSSTPGPNNVMLATSGALFGYRRALPQIFGTNSGVAVQTFITCLGLGSLFVAFPVLHQMSAHHRRAVPGVSGLEAQRQFAGRGRDAKPLSFAQAALFQAVNPKSWVKAITLASVFMPAGLSAPVGALLVAVVGLVIGFPSASMWALFGVAIRRLLTDPRKQRIFNLSMGAMLLVLAVSFLR